MAKPGMPFAPEPQSVTKVPRFAEVKVIRCNRLRGTWVLTVRAEDTTIHPSTATELELTVCHVFDAGREAPAVEGDRGAVIYPMADNFRYAYWLGKIHDPYTFRRHEIDPPPPPSRDVNPSAQSIGIRNSGAEFQTSGARIHYRGSSLVMSQDGGAHLKTEKGESLVLAGGLGSSGIVSRSDFKIVATDGAFRVSAQNARINLPGGWFKVASESAQFEVSRAIVSTGILKIRAASAAAFADNPLAPAIDISTLQGDMALAVGQGDYRLSVLDPTGEILQYVGPDPDAALASSTFDNGGIEQWVTPAGKIKVRVGITENTQSAYLTLTATDAKFAWAAAGATQGALTHDSTESLLEHKLQTKIVGGQSQLRMLNSGQVELQAGAGAGIEFAALGETLKSKLDELIDAILALTVPTGVGPSGTPINAASFQTIKSSLQQILSTAYKHN